MRGEGYRFVGISTPREFYDRQLLVIPTPVRVPLIFPPFCLYWLGSFFFFFCCLIPISVVSHRQIIHITAVSYRPCGGLLYYARNRKTQEELFFLLHYLLIGSLPKKKRAGKKCAKDAQCHLAMKVAARQFGAKFNNFHVLHTS